MTKESKCNCQHCDQSIVFPTEMAGQTAECPGCKLETMLFVRPEPPKATPPKNFIPDKKPESKIEDTLEAIGRIFFYLSILGGAIASTGGILFASQDSDSGENPIGIVVSIVLLMCISVAIGIFWRTIFRAIAEIIRLLRQLVKLQSERK